ncbi:alpha-amylase family glycosyl hydrolase [Flavihumibacter fluvii]|uniref:alpha-amylase family glycosyl hydrolase n=1 Tax=Flavihumibacter fluvii TaxID=2838157 RepID=UPI001BDF3723|nr:alpha-amylase family glycosyl hydrolase [Flavihumibacter fluvii]ULQ52896.1 alpha-amylase family glycosyl hydrolase [Flavihumibacter fluvii]
MKTASFTPLEWSHSTNIYEVNLRQYTIEGSFSAFSKELPRLRDMGVEVLWFMPITPIAIEKRLGTLGSYYACLDYTATNPEYGTIDDFKTLVNDAHLQGFKVIIDWVANHTGCGHVWTKTHPDYFRKNARGEFYDKNGWEDVIDLDFDNPAMRHDLIEAMRFWVRECDIDGFRCDMAMLVPLDFWKDARTILDQDKKLFWLAECEDAHYHEAFDATYTWEWMHKTEEFVKHKTDMHGLESLLWKYSHHFAPTAIRAFFTTNHDENSWNGTEFEKYGDAAKTLAVFSATWNGIPLVYSGQELPNLKRLKFFDKDPIDWNGRYELHDFYKTLLTLHKTHPALRAGDLQVTTHRVRTTNDKEIFAFIRKHDQGEVLVLLNLSAHQKHSFTIHDKFVRGAFKEVFDGSIQDFTHDHNSCLPAWGYKVYARNTY